MAPRKPKISLNDAKMQLEAKLHAQIEKEVAARLSDTRKLRSREDQVDYALRRVIEQAQERTIGKYFGSYNGFNPNKNAALTALDNSVEDRIVYETTLQVLQLREDKELQKQIASSVQRAVEIAIARHAERVANEYVKNLFDKYETEKLLLIAKQKPEDET